MKSIFKKIAFVLALAMVVTMLPAKAVSAASSDGPDMYKSLLLYLDSGNGEGADITGTYKSERYASVWGWREAGYTSVDFESADTSIATVNSKGKVSAVKVGTTTVTATFTADDMETVEKTCKVTVKRNAAKVGLSADSATQVADGSIKVGDKVQLTAVRKDAEGKTEWNKTMKEYTTDSVRFLSLTPEIFTVTKTTGMLTAVGAGEGTLKVWTVQSEGRDQETGEYPEVVSKEYTIVVSENSIKVEQSASNAFTMVFPDEATAKAAVDATLPSLTNADASVSEDKNVVKAYEVLHAATDKTAAAEQEIFISGISNSKNIVTVTLFNELKEDTNYTVRYQDYVEHFVTCKNVAVKLVPYAETVSQSELAVEKVIKYRLYALGVNNQDVDITNSKAYGEGAWADSVKLEDLAKDYDPKYVFNGNTIWFYTLDQNFAVNLKATFEDWYIVQGNTANILEAPITVTPGNTSITAGNIVGWGIVKENDDNAYTNQKLAVEDVGYRLAVKASINVYGKDDTVETSKGVGLFDDKFTFISSNDDKLSINEDTGVIYPPKSAVSNVLVHVYYDGSYVGSCAVTVVAKRTFTSLSVNTNGKTKLAAGENFLDNLWFEVKTYDQLGAEFNGGDDGYISVNMTVSDVNKATYVELGSWYAAHGSGNDLDFNMGNDYEHGICVTEDAPTKATPIRVVVTATYHSNDGKVTFERKASFNFTVKNTNGGQVKTYMLEAGSNSVDEALYVLGTDNTAVSNKNVELKAYSVDKEGYKVKQLTLNAVEDDLVSGSNLATGQATILVKKGNETITTKGTADELGFVIETNEHGMTSVRFTAVGTVSGSAVSGSAVTASTIEKIETGSYVINLFVGENNKATFKASQVISVIDKQDMPTFKWVRNTVSDGSDIDIAKQALTLHFDANRDWNVEEVTGGITAADVRRVGNRATIRSVNYDWETPDGDILTFVIQINRTVIIGD